MISIKSKKDLQMLSESGRILAKVMREIEKIIRPGITTSDIDRLSYELILKYNAGAAFKGYKGYPAAACVSVNEEVVHGIPGPRVILEGDIVGIDLGVNYKGYFSDMAITLPVGAIDPKKKKLIEVTRQSLDLALGSVYPGNNLNDISHSIQNCAEAAGFSVVRQFVGHGIGTALHEEPEIPNFVKAQAGPVLKSGMVLAIEPMVNMGGWECVILNNGWTAVTKDGLPSAHFEHTVAVTDKGPLVLTR